MSRRTTTNKKSHKSKKLSDNSNMVFFVETVESLTPDRSVESSKQALSSSPINQIKTRTRRTEPLNPVGDTLEPKSQRKAKSSSKVKKKIPKQLSSLSAIIVDNDVGSSGKTPQGKENNPSTSGLSTRTTRSKRKMSEKAVQDSTISTLSETSVLNDCSFVTLRRNRTPREKSDQSSTLNKTPGKFGGRFLSFKFQTII